MTELTTPDILFHAFNLAVLPAWLLLLFTPWWKFATDTLCSVVATGLLAIAYLVLFGALARTGSLGNLTSLVGVQMLFTSDWFALAGWLHYLCFDLFVGAWIARDAHRNNISRWRFSPCLFLTFLFGPIGLLLYITIRAVTLGKLSLAQAPTES